MGELVSIFLMETSDVSVLPSGQESSVKYVSISSKDACSYIVCIEVGIHWLMVHPFSSAAIHCSLTMFDPVVRENKFFRFLN